MTKKVILTSILSLCFAMPAFAEFTSGQQIADENGLLNGMACDEDTLGVTQDTANLEAIWTPNTYSISYYCEEGQTAMIGTPIICGNPEYENTEQCLDREHATYGNPFLFAEAAICSRSGYTLSGWSCTRDDTVNDTPVLYTLGQRIASWDITSDLTCMATYTGKTITLDWYDGDAKQNVSGAAASCVYGTPNNQTGGLTLPNTPANKTGYTFGGWKIVDNVCTKFGTQSACDANSSCFWYEDSGTGSCINIKSCGDNEDKTSCNATGYCSWYIRALGGAKHCNINNTTLCHASGMQSEQNCSAHSDHCGWDETTQSCLTLMELRDPDMT